MSLPSTDSNPVITSVMPMPVSVESSAATSTRASLMSILTESLDLESYLESILGGETRPDCT